MDHVYGLAADTVTSLNEIRPEEGGIRKKGKKKKKGGERERRKR